MLSVRALAMLIGASLFGSGVLAGPSAAAPIYDNIHSGTDVSVSPAGFDPAAYPANGGSGPLFNSFSTGALTTLVNNVQVIVNTSGSPTDGGTFSLAIVGDSLGSPDVGTVFASSGAINDSVLSTDAFTGSIYHWNLPTVSLTPNTTYWVALQDSCDPSLPGVCTASSAQWAFAVDSTGIGIAGNQWGDTNGFSLASDASPPFEMTVQLAVPEPATIALFVVGLICLGYVRSCPSRVQKSML
jgi:hypothetical protein